MEESNRVKRNSLKLKRVKIQFTRFCNSSGWSGRSIGLCEVTSGEIIVDAAGWGTIDTWKDKYDNAIANLLKGMKASMH